MFPRILYIPKSQTLLYRNINYIYMKLGYVEKNMIKFEKNMKIWENMGKHEKYEKLRKSIEKSKNRKIHVFQYQLLLWSIRVL